MNMRGPMVGTFSAMLLGSLCCSVAQCTETTELTLAQEGFAATYYGATEEDRSVGIIVLGGSEGGKPWDQAKTFVDAGFPTLALAYFKAPGLPGYLDEIPLEYFEKPIKWFSNHPNMRGKKIVLWGAAKGAELALLLASRRSDVSGVIAFAPGSVVFQGIPKVFWPGPPRSSWTAGGKPIPFVPYDLSKGVDPRNLLPLYERSLAHADIAAQAAIPVEKINGPILLLSGEDDGKWPASTMADEMIERLKEKEFPHAFQHVKYENAGHDFLYTNNAANSMGGTEEGNSNARLDFVKRVRTFIRANF